MKKAVISSIVVGAPAAHKQAYLSVAAVRPARAGHKATGPILPFDWGSAAKSIAVLAVETGMLEPVSGLCLGALAVVMEAANGRPRRRAA
jgi:hypothetical protein